ncbi:MAG TPA: glutamine--fructose-6-phosphate transaminase (isomerizing) [Gemmataceae bacterium]|jgi:glucosamine--fructose-6-phosphate aminotransferase (isomerizing)|nr:glutamine--fructose-6-phosphate transaminase (isomerizing) [Gemmataceae bacterium]
MCGIVGYTGIRDAQPILLSGLFRLEYRGYDSAGIATIDESGLCVRKSVGRIAELESLLKREHAPGRTGISHTRWATHGAATDANAHPHVGGNGEVAVVHNGIIENYSVLKSQLEADGFVFRSQTDTEVIAHLIAKHLSGDLVDAVRSALAYLKGTFGLAVVSPRFPGLIVGARLGSPLVVGVGDGEAFLASDPSALVGYTDSVIYLEDNQLCVLRPNTWEVLTRDRATHEATVHVLEGVREDIELGGYDHFMLKEIHEQPEVIARALAGRLDDAEATARFGGLNLDPAQLRQVDRIILTACGTSFHAGLVGKSLIEQFARIPVEVEYASEFRYRNSPLASNSVVMGITQSGETADTLAALREVKRKGLRTLALCNVVGSTIAREADGGVYLHAGPEIGVASTKAFTAQVTVLTLLAVYLGRMRHMSSQAGARILDELTAMPDIVRRTLKCADHVADIAKKYAHVDNMLYLGRQYLYPMALEGALKLKEISYIHAEGYPAAEMKHGPIALVDEETPSVFLVPHGNVYDKVMSNLEEIKARGGPVIAIACADDNHVVAKADDVICIPSVPDYLQPLVTAIPLQFLAYHIALLRGCDIDKPRNLAKSVTVE